MYDYLIQNGLLIDGTGAAAYAGDLAISGGKIAAIGDLKDAQAKETIDAAGRYVTPGFIDIHRHADAAIFRPGFGQLELAQGLTTIVNGNCGLSAVPVPARRRAEICSYLGPVVGQLREDVDFSSVASYVAAARQTTLPLNVGILVGGGTIRAAAVGYDPTPLSEEQLQQVHTLMRESLEAGALGVSLGLGYAPECFYSTQGLIDALAPLKDSGTVIAVHMRQEGAGVIGALEEMLTMARALRTPVHISHLKGMGKENWGKFTPKMLQMLADARAEGLDVSCDIYPYLAGSTQLIHILPPECQDGGLEELSQNLLDPDFRAHLRQRMETGEDFENIVRLCGWENVVATTASLPQHQSYLGRSILEIAQEQGKDTYDVAFDLLAAEHCQVAMIDFVACEEDLCAALKTDFVGVISDSTYPGAGRLHPRVYGAYPRLLQHFVRELGVLTAEQAIHKITMQAADRYGLSQKGRLQMGCDADVNVFDPAQFREMGTYLDPAQLAQGMDTVFVNGVPAIRDGAFTGACAGTMVTRR